MLETASTNLPVKDVVRHLTHELRQPLSALESIAFYLKMTVGGASGADIVLQVNRLQQMVDSANWVLSDVLHLMQMAPPSPEAVDIPELAEEVLTESWVSEGLAVQREFTPGLRAAWADIEQLRHLLRSVFQFLRRSIDEPQAINVSGTSTTRSLLLEFRASAPRMTPESLFNPLEPNQLLTCRRIADNNGGRFSAEKDDRGWLCLRLELPTVALA
jgi:light-regulated signal transduction histidine kinase (bacteriophytochrome)